MTDQHQAAFFDVDSTLLARSGLWDFLGYHLTCRYGPELATARMSRHRRELQTRESAGQHRDELARDFYRIWAGVPVSQLHEEGRAWFAAADDGTLFYPPVERRLRDHAADRHLVVLVSGSFAACLEPIAAKVSAHAVLSSEPETSDGYYTGEVDVPMIGEAKAEAIRRFASERAIRLADSFAYGDHSSDLPMLQTVGHPIVVGDDPVLTSRVGPTGAPSFQLINRSHP